MADWGGHSPSGFYVAYGATEASAGGILVTPSASTNVKGSWVEMTAATEAHHSGLRLCVNSHATSASARHLVDIGIGAAASEVVLIPDIFLFLTSSKAQGYSREFPIRVPRGSRLSVRSQNGVASGSGCRQMILGENSAAARGFNGCDAIGIVSASTSIGGHTTIAAGTVYSDWYEITAATDRAYRALSIGVGCSMTTEGRFLMQIATGAASSEHIICTIPSGTGNHNYGVISLSLPAGTRLSLRGVTSVSAALYASLHGLY